MSFAVRAGAAAAAAGIAIAAAPFALAALLFAGVSTPGCEPALSSTPPVETQAPGLAPAARPTQCPATGELVLPLPPGYTISDGYGWRNLGMGTNPFHRGVDLVAACGTPVFAMMSGTVISADRLTILIETPSIARIGYLHTAIRDHLVRPGDTVTAGQQISSVGSEPPSTGCHLDVRVDTAETSDPRVRSIQPALGAGHSWVDPIAFSRALGVELCPVQGLPRRRIVLPAPSPIQ